MVRMLCVELIDRDGRVVEEKCVDKEVFEKYVSERKDISTYNWIYIIATMFQSALDSVYLYNISNTRVLAYFRPVTSLPTFMFTGSRVYISLGTDSTSPTVYDYSLRAKVVEKEVESISIDVSSSLVSLTATFIFTSQATIYEVGLEMDIMAEVGGTITNTRILLDRTVVSGGITVQASQSLRVTYRFSL
jgi:hypothetical protein